MKRSAQGIKVDRGLTVHGDMMERKGKGREVWAGVNKVE